MTTTIQAVASVTVPVEAVLVTVEEVVVDVVGVAVSRDMCFSIEIRALYR